MFVLAWVTYYFVFIGFELLIEESGSPWLLILPFITQHSVTDSCIFALSSSSLIFMTIIRHSILFMLFSWVYGLSLFLYITIYLLFIRYSDIYLGILYFYLPNLSWITLCHNRKAMINLILCIQDPLRWKQLINIILCLK